MPSEYSVVNSIQLRLTNIILLVEIILLSSLLLSPHFELVLPVAPPAPPPAPAPPPPGFIISSSLVKFLIVSSLEPPEATVEGRSASACIHRLSLRHPSSSAISSTSTPTQCGKVTSKRCTKGARHTSPKQNPLSRKKGVFAGSAPYWQRNLSITIIPAFNFVSS